MRILAKHSLTVIGLVAALQAAAGYRIASINDIHADLGYNPSQGSCISKVTNTS